MKKKLTKEQALKNWRKAELLIEKYRNDLKDIYLSKKNGQDMVERASAMLKLRLEDF